MKIKTGLTFLFFVASLCAAAQTQYKIIPDEKEPGKNILVGIITKETIMSDTAYKWYSQNQVIYAHPDTSIVNAFARNKDEVSYLIFGGTWCEDTQFIIPKFFILQEKAGLDESHVTLFALDRKKQTAGNMASVFKIKNTPTIVVMKEGKEIGRVIEYGSTGKWDRELADILNK